MKTLVLLLILTKIVYSDKPWYEYPTNIILRQLKTYLENIKVDDLKKLRLNEYFQDENECLKMIKEGHGYYLEFFEGSHSGLSLLRVIELIFKFYKKIKMGKIKNSCWEYFLNFDLSFIRTVFYNGRGISKLLNNNEIIDRFVTGMGGVKILTVEEICKLIFKEFEFQALNPVRYSGSSVFSKSLSVIFIRVYEIYHILFGLEGINGLVKNNNEL